MAEVLVPVVFGAALVLASLMVFWHMMANQGSRLPEDEALEIAVRRLLFSDKIHEVEQLVPDHVARLRVMLDRMATVVQEAPPE